MIITVHEIKDKYIKLLNKHISREEVDRWAYSVIQQNEAGTLIFSPVQEKNKMWQAIMFLYGIDTQESPDEYLHTDDDILEIFNELFRYQ